MPQKKDIDHTIILHHITGFSKYKLYYKYNKGIFVILNIYFLLISPSTFFKLFMFCATKKLRLPVSLTMWRDSPEG